jgi:glucan-binding YG repeat protein
MHTAVIYYGDIKFPEFQQQQKQAKIETTIDLNFVSGIVDKKETLIEDQSEEEKNEPDTQQEAEVQKDLEKLSMDKKEEEKVENQEKTEKKTGYLIVMGGRYIDQFSQEVLCLNLETFEWKYLGNTPMKLGAHAGEICGDKIFLFGGTDGLQFLDTLYYYDIPKNKWFIYSEKRSEKLKPRIAASLCYNPVTNELMLFGGCSYEDELNELNFVSLNEQALGKLFQKL